MEVPNKTYAQCHRHPAQPTRTTPKPQPYHPLFCQQAVAAFQSVYVEYCVCLGGVSLFEEAKTMEMQNKTHPIQTVTTVLNVMVVASVSVMADSS